MKKKTKVLIVIAIIIAVFMAGRLTVKLISQDKRITEVVNYDSNMFTMDYYNSVFTIDTEYEICRIYIDNSDLKGETKQIVNGIEYSFDTDKIPKDEIFDIKIELYNNDEKENTIINAKNVYCCTSDNIDNTLFPDNIEYFIFCNPEITGDIQALNKLEKLKYLDINDIKNVTGNLESLSNLNLVYLIINKSNIRGDLDALKNMNNIEYLHVDTWSGSFISGDLSSLSNLTKMKHLYLSGLYNIKGDVDYLSGMKELEYLSLVHLTNLQSNARTFCNFNNLEYLNLDVTYLKGNMWSIGSLKNLKYLQIKSCDFRIWGNIRALKELDKLEELNLTYNDFIRGNIKVFNEMDNLSKVKIRYCQWIWGEATLSTGEKIEVKFYEKAGLNGLSDYQSD